MKQQHPWNLNWAGEFVSITKENDFRQDIWPHKARHIRLVAIWGSLIFCTAIFTDYLGLGETASFFQIAALRLLVPLVALWPYLVSRRPEFSRQSDLALTVMCSVAALAQSYVVYIWPQAAELHIYGLIAMGLVFWLFIPTGLIYNIISNLILNSSFLVAYISGNPDAISIRLYTTLIVLLSINVLGFITLRELKSARRAQYANTIRIAETEENYRQVIDNATDGIVVVQDSLVVLANPRILQMSGYTAEQLIGSSIEGYLLPTEKETLLEYGRRRTEGGEVPSVYQTRFKGPKGRWLLAEVSGVVIKWRGRPAVLYFLADISERIKSQAEEREVAKLQGVMEMAGAASHEVNQPLQIMATLTELAKLELPEDSPVQARLLAMEESLERLRKLTSKIQRISRYETMDYTEKTRIIDIDKASSE